MAPAYFGPKSLPLFDVPKPFRLPLTFVQVHVFGPKLMLEPYGRAVRPGMSLDARGGHLGEKEGRVCIDSPVTFQWYVPRSQVRDSLWRSRAWGTADLDQEADQCLDSA